jgi:hypothetical protein
MSYTLRGGHGEVRAAVELPQRNPCRNAWLTIRAPENRKIALVRINGKPWGDVDAARNRIRLPKTNELIEVVVKTRP